jgi:hypothetical protein
MSTSVILLEYTSSNKSCVHDKHIVIMNMFCVVKKEEDIQDQVISLEQESTYGSAN